MLRGRAALILRVAAILVPALLVYWQDLEVVATDALTSDVMSYILVIPLFIAFALYRKRRMLQAVTPLENKRELRLGEEIAGLSLCFSALIIYWHGSYTFYPVEYHLLSMPIFLAGAILLVYNWQTLRQLVLPVALLLFLEPLPLQLANIIGFQASALSSVAAYNLAKFSGLPVTLTTQQTPIITTQTVQGTQLPLVIDVACSGIYSLTGFALFAVFAAFIMRGPAWKRAALFSAGFPMIYGLNVLRIAAIVWVGHGWGEGAATRAFHLLGGSVLILIAIFIVLVVGVRVGKLRIFASTVREEPCEFCDESMRRRESFCSYCGRFLKPRGQEVTTRRTVGIASIIAVAILVLLTQIPPFAVAMGTASIDLNTFSPTEIKSQILPTIPGWDLDFFYRDTNVERTAGWDAALVYAYRKQGYDEPRPAVSVLIQIATSRHTWEASLYVWPARYGQPTATMLEEKDVDILDLPKITGRFLEFIRAGSTAPEVLVYWFEKALFTANDSAVTRYVSISLDTYPEDLARAGLIEGPNDADGMQALLLPMAKNIVQHWEPMKALGLIKVGLGEFAGHTFILAIAPCIAVIASLYLKRWTDRKRKAEIYRSLELPHEIIALEALALASKETLPTGTAIEAKHLEITGNTIETKALIETLNQAADTGLVTKHIGSREDEPLLLWKQSF